MTEEYFLGMLLILVEVYGFKTLYYSYAQFVFYILCSFNPSALSGPHHGFPTRLPPPVPAVFLQLLALFFTVYSLPRF